MSVPSYLVVYQKEQGQFFLIVTGWGGGPWGVSWDRRGGPGLSPRCMLFGIMGKNGSTVSPGQKAKTGEGGKNSGAIFAHTDGRS